MGPVLREPWASASSEKHDRTRAPVPAVDPVRVGADQPADLVAVPELSDHCLEIRHVVPSHVALPRRPTYRPGLAPATRNIAEFVCIDSSGGAAQAPGRPAAAA